MSTALHSFDIFDTTLVRVWASPSDLFLQVGDELKRAGVIRCSPDEWATYRSQAERNVASRYRDREIRLSEIYDEIGVIAGMASSLLQFAMEKELDVEDHSLKTVPEIERRIQNKSRNGDRVAFISDVYLPGERVRSWLEARKLATGETPVHVSAESGLRKISGELYGLVRKKEGAAAREWFHVGDNRRADVECARESGVRAEHFTATTLNRYERMIAGDPSLPILQRSLVAGACRLARLEGWNLDPHRRTVWDTGASVIGPAFYGFIYWVLREAERRGLRRLYFVARDGQIFHRVAETLAKTWGIPLELRYLYGSRQAWHLPSIRSNRDESLGWILSRTPGMSVETVLKRVNIVPEEIRDALGSVGLGERKWAAPLGPEEERLLRNVLSVESVWSRIERRANEARATATDYLRQEGFYDKVPFGIVDIGWFGNMQRSLAGILETDDGTPFDSLVGFYFHVRRQDAGRRAGEFVSYVENSVRSGAPDWLRVALLEIFAAADHGGTLGYRRTASGVEPQLSAEIDTPAVEWGVDTQQEGILAFAFALNESFKQFDLEPTDFLPICARILGEFAARPDRREATTYGRFPVNSDQAGERAYPFAPETSAIEALRYAAAGIRGTGERWTEGMAARSGRIPRLLLRTRLAIRNWRRASQVR